MILDMVCYCTDISAQDLTCNCIRRQQVQQNDESYSVGVLDESVPRDGQDDSASAHSHHTTFPKMKEKRENSSYVVVLNLRYDAPI